MVNDLGASEYSECVLLTDYLENLKRENKIKLFTHIANETFTKSWSVKNKNKRMGVRRGFPDYAIVIKKGKVIFIEMKWGKNKATEEQKEWLELLPNAYLCYGFNEAQKVIEEALS